MEIIMFERLSLPSYTVDVYLGRDENLRTMVKLVLRKPNYAAEWRFDLEIDELEEIWNTVVRLNELMNEVEGILLGGGERVE